jgi:hypothetical protein
MVAGLLTGGVALLMIPVSFFFISAISHPGPIYVGVERVDGGTTILAPDCGEPWVSAPDELIVTELLVSELGVGELESAGPRGSGSSGSATRESTTLTVADGDLEVSRAEDFSGWRLTSSALPSAAARITPNEGDRLSEWFGVLPADPPEGLSVAGLGDSPGGVVVTAAADIDDVVRIACRLR